MPSSYFTSIFVIFIAVIYVEQCQAKCVMYGFCNQRSGDSFQSCPFSGEPKPMTNQTGLDILKRRCPHFFNGDDTPSVCCNDEQMLSLESQYQTMSAVFKRCPACSNNILRYICDSTCSPNQSDFLLVKKTEMSPQTSKSYVQEVIVFCNSEWINGTFDSCSDVIVPSLGIKAVDASCGVHAGHCTPLTWFGFMGDSDVNPASPMKIDMIAQDTPFMDFKPYNPSFKTCYGDYNGTVTPCSCTDCKGMCPAPAVYPDPDAPFLLLRVDAYIFIFSLIYILLSSAFISSRVYLHRSKSKRLEIGEAKISPELTNTISANQQRFRKVQRCLDAGLENFFKRVGTFVGNNPAKVIVVASLVAASLCVGSQFLIITTDPVEIWASPVSRSRIEKDYFDSRFGPFYRTEQMFIKTVGLKSIQHNTSNGMIEFGPAFNKEVLLTLYELQNEIQKIPGLDEICFAPLSATGLADGLNQCTVESIWGYFQNDMSLFNATSVDQNNFTVNYLDVIYNCLQNSVDPKCLAPYGGNVDPALGVGGFLKYGQTAYEKADALVLTFIVTNHKDPTMNLKALEWEQEYLNLMKKWTEEKCPDYLDIAYSAERSIQDELERESVSELSTVAISYILMFIYISFALGSVNSFKTFFVDSKIGLGLGGVMVVIVSVVCSLGIFGYIGVPTTLLTIEVIPFLVLAVGVDNMFILVSYHKKNINPDLTAAENVGNTLGKVGPSLLLTTVSEAACFSIGGLSKMPAVNTFALYATVALICDFILQVTVFTAFLTYNTKRVAANRLDLCCCLSITCDNELSPGGNYIYEKMEKWIVPFIFKGPTRWGILLVFLFWACASAASIPHIEPGLDQQLSMPQDSYVVKYFGFMNDVLSIGPPVYFVLKSGLNFSSTNEENLICGGLHCNSDSMNIQIYTASKQSNRTYIAKAAASWVDDFNDWSTVSDCCKMYSNKTFCPHSSTSDLCHPCNVPLNSDDSRPSDEAFQVFLPFFLKDNPDTKCAKGGHAAYSGGVNYFTDKRGFAQVEDSYFMAFHTPLKTSKDYYRALEMARQVSSNITKTIQSSTSQNVEVFPYSIFYVFYEQYLNIWEDTLTSLGFCLLAVTLVTFTLTGFDLISSLVVLCTVTMIIIDLAGLMYWWDITLNAISLVNLVMAVGISVEFCSHILHSFILAEGNSRMNRAKFSLLTTGSSVFSGITLTKFLGIIVLAFSKTQIFQIFYFRMYLGMILIGAAHGLLFLPILLSYVGSSYRY